MPEAEEPQIEWVGEHDQDLAELEAGFQFVAETGLSRPKGRDRSVIRSRASGKKLSRNENSLPESLTPLLSKFGLKGTKDRSRSVATRLWGHQTLKDTSCCIDRGPSTNWFDPFDTLPVDKRGNSHYILTQYNAMFYPSDNPFSPRQSFTKEDILCFSMSEAASLHVFLAYVAMSISNPANPKLVVDANYHFGQAIASINKEIADSSHKVVTNATIFAVGCLAHAEITSNSTRLLKMHLDGLEALVKIKGGIHALVGDPFTLRFARWVDNVCSIAMGSKPRFSFVNQTPQPDPTRWEPYSDIGLRYRLRLSNLTGLQELAKETIEVYHILRNLITGKQKSSQKMGIGKREFELYANQLMSRLINIVQHKESDFLSQNALIFGLFGHAALAHVTTFICNPARRGSVLELMSIRIRASLEVICVQSFQVAYPEMMLWIIMVGGLASTGTVNQEWFAKVLSESCLAAGISEITELPLFLSEFLWSDSYLGPVCKEFWDCVAAALAMEAENEVRGSSASS